jgi:hypothetical protein
MQKETSATVLEKNLDYIFLLSKIESNKNLSIVSSTIEYVYVVLYLRKLITALQDFKKQNGCPEEIKSVPNRSK